MLQRSKSWVPPCMNDDQRSSGTLRVFLTVISIAAMNRSYGTKTSPSILATGDSLRWSRLCVRLFFEKGIEPVFAGLALPKRLCEDNKGRH